jgi:RecB family exonuclease
MEHKEKGRNYRIFLPNLRSCRKLKSYFLNFIKDSFFVPEMESISDAFALDEQKLMFLFMSMLKAKNPRISINAICDLSKNLASSVKKLILNDFGIERMKEVIPDCEISDILLDSVEISRFVEIFREKANHFVASLQDQRIIAVGISNSNHYTTLFLKHVVSSSNGIVVICGAESRHHKNYLMNKKMLDTLVRSSECQRFLAMVKRDTIEFYEVSSEERKVSDGFHKIGTSDDRVEDQKNIAADMIIFDSEKYPINPEDSIEVEEFESQFDEAFAVALAVREAIFKNSSVLVVSQDQNLTERLKFELRRWNIWVDDSLGNSFAKTTCGIILASVMEALLRRQEVGATLRLLKLNKNFYEKAQELEEFARRLVFIPSNFFTIFDWWVKKDESPEFVMAVEKLREIRLNVLSRHNVLSMEARINTMQDCERSRCCVPAVHECSSSGSAEVESGKNTFNFGLFDPNDSKSFDQWLKICEKIFSIVSPENSTKLSDALDEILRNSRLLPQMNFGEFCTFFKVQMLQLRIRESAGHAQNIVILGAMEAQLLEADLIVLAGANEKFWSVLEKNDFSLGEKSRKELKLPEVGTKNEFLLCLLERLLHKNQVLITRSKTVNGEQQQKCEYLEKMAQLLRLEDGNRFKTLINHLEKASGQEVIPLEKPNPGLCYRPQKIWASEVELLLENPYAFYAKKILGLREMNVIGDGKNIWGNYLHLLLEKFIGHSFHKKDRRRWNCCTKEILKNNGLVSSDLGVNFFKLGEIFSFVATNIDDAHKYFTEIEGEMEMQISSDYHVSLNCRADRVDIFDDKSIGVVDYKGGKSPGKSETENGPKLQLLVEGLMAMSGGFGPENTDIKTLSFWKLGGKNGGKVMVISNDQEKTIKICLNAERRLRELINKYNVLGATYDINISHEYGKTYLHLARAKELWTM